MVAAGRDFAQFQTRRDSPAQAAQYPGHISRLDTCGSDASRYNMKRLASKIAVNTALLVTLVTAGSASAQTREADYAQTSEVRQGNAPAYADDSCQSGEYGPPVRVKPGDVVEDGEIVGRDPDPNIRTRLERENFPGSNDCY
jgi:hypothetical protein